MHFFRVTLALAGAFLFAASASAGEGGAGLLPNWQPVQTSRTSAWRYLDKSQIRVIDGDTLAYKGRSIRLLSIQAPELHRVCAEEMALGQQSKAHAVGLVGSAHAVRAGFLYRTNRAGQVVRATDKYGRFLAQILLDREDLAGLMIEAKLALPWDGKGAKPSWCPVPVGAGTTQ